MAWVRCCGGKQPSNFPWSAIALGSFDNLSLTVPNGTTGYCRTTVLSPTIESGCLLSFDVSWDGSTANRSIFIQVSTDGNTWNNIGTHSGTSSYIGSVSLNVYVGAPIYIRVGFSNSQGTSTVMHVNGMNIIKT